MNHSIESDRALLVAVRAQCLVISRQWSEAHAASPHLAESLPDSLDWLRIEVAARGFAEVSSRDVAAMPQKCAALVMQSIVMQANAPVLRRTRFISWRALSALQFVACMRCAAIIAMVRQ
jgi:hypothetical protein